MSVNLRKCNVCGNELSDNILSLPKLPLTEFFFKSPTPVDQFLFDQTVYHCEKCSHTQLGNIIPPEKLYYSSYFFLTSKSPTGKKANDQFLKFIRTIIRPSIYSNIIEIGCNDLYLLTQLTEYGEEIVGIDPSLTSHNGDLSDSNLIKKIGKLVEEISINDYVDCSKSTLIISSHTLEHIVNPATLFQTLINQFDREITCIFQFPIMEYILENNRYDQIFHQHVNYFSKRSIKYLIGKYGGVILAESANPHHWGSYMVAFTLSRKSGSVKKHPLPETLVTPSLIKSQYLEFCNQMKYLNTILTKMILSHEMAAYGAALMIPILSYHIQFDFSRFDKIIDDDPKKHGLYYPGISTPISTPDEKSNYDDSCIFISAVDNTLSILIKAIALNPYEIIIPFHQIK